MTTSFLGAIYRRKKQREVKANGILRAKKWEPLTSQLAAAAVSSIVREESSEMESEQVFEVHSEKSCLEYT